MACDRSVEDSLPEFSRDLPAAKFTAEPVPPPPQEFGEFTNALGNDGLDGLAQTPRQHRRCATRTNRNGDLSPIDKGGKNKGRELWPIDDVDRRSRFAGDDRQTLVRFIAIG